MKFLFIVQGEGRGHLTQAIAMRNILCREGHEVTNVLVGKNPHRVIPPFFYDKIQAPVDTFDSPNFVFDKDNKGISISSTLIENLIHSHRFFKSIFFIHQQVKQHQPDVIINFYDILGGLYNAVFNTTSAFYCVAHQYMIMHPEFEYAKGNPLDKWLLKLNTTLTGLMADKYLALSFYKTYDIPHKKLYVVPPLLRQEVLAQQPEDGNHILAYILNDGYRQEIIHWHQHHSEEVVHFFGDGKYKTDEMEIAPNLTWHKINDVQFLNYMRTSKGYVSTAGFESICEAMYFQKPIMMIPTQGHYEQACNAIDAVKAGAGISGDSFDISQLIDYIPQYQPNRTFVYWVQSAPQMFMNRITEENYIRAWAV